jgi:hypothetical protein
MKNKIIEASELPENEKVYLKKDWLGWRVVAPVKNEDGSWNWFNIVFGGKKNLFVLIILFLLAVLAFFALKEYVAISIANAIRDPCALCIGGIG